MIDNIISNHKIRMGLLVLALLALGSCELLVDLTTDDSTGRIEYPIDSTFAELSLREDMDLELIESDENVLVIEGPNAILDKITISQIDGKVEVTYKKRGDWKYDKPHLQLKMPKIVPIRSYKFNNVYSPDTLRTPKLNFFSDGTGDFFIKVNNQTVSCSGTHITNFYVSGFTKQLNVGVSYSSSIKGSKLIAETVNVNSFASNNQVVFPVLKLSCTIRQKGNVYYVNQPGELTVNIADDAKGRAIYDRNAH